MNNKLTKAEDIAEKKEAILLYFRTLPVYKYAAHSVGISQSTLERWREDDTEFDDKLKEAASSFYAAKSRQAKAEFVLERLDKEVWAPPKQEQEIQVNVIHAILDKYSGTREGKIYDVPRPESITGGSSEDSA